MRIGHLGLQGGGAYFRFGTGAMRRARAAVSVGPLSDPPPVDSVDKVGKEPNILYGPSARPAELQAARSRSGHRLDIKV